jgi:outer membrane protein assembly factor BamE (lipoprotein component of BamABCDE complex)
MKAMACAESDKPWRQAVQRVCRKKKMKQQSNTLRGMRTAAFAGALLTAACAASAQDEAVSFPDPASAYLQEGSFVSLENLRNVAPGLTKNQVRELLGSPHFSEGVFGVKTWNYIFHFRRGGQIVTCQYQVQYDDGKLLRSTYWNRQECEDIAKTGTP